MLINDSVSRYTMSTTYDESELPPESITIDGKTWTREKFDTASYQWVRPMRESEFDWDPENVSLVGTEEPIRVVELQYRDEVWNVSAAETAGPEYHRPGFTELISGDYTFQTRELQGAADKVREFVKQLS